MIQKDLLHPPTFSVLTSLPLVKWNFLGHGLPLSWVATECFLKKFNLLIKSKIGRSTSSHMQTSQYLATCSHIRRELERRPQFSVATKVSETIIFHWLMKTVLLFAILETWRKLGRVNFRKEFWDRHVLHASFSQYFPPFPSNSTRSLCER